MPVNISGTDDHAHRHHREHRHPHVPVGRDDRPGGEPGDHAEHDIGEEVSECIFEAMVHCAFSRSMPSTPITGFCRKSISA
jgi:hypothetical protein